MPVRTLSAKLFFKFGEEIVDSEHLYGRFVIKLMHGYACPRFFMLKGDSGLPFFYRQTPQPFPLGMAVFLRVCHSPFFPAQEFGFLLACLSPLLSKVWIKRGGVITITGIFSMTARLSVAGSFDCLSKGKK
jgi:hypothetical protein